MLGSVHYFLHGYGRSPAGTAFVLFDPDDLYELCGVSEVLLATRNNNTNNNNNNNEEEEEALLSLPDDTQRQQQPPGVAGSSGGSSGGGGGGGGGSRSSGSGVEAHRNTVRKQALSVLLLRYAVGQWPTLDAVLEAGLEPTELRLSSLGALRCVLYCSSSVRCGVCACASMRAHLCARCVVFDCERLPHGYVCKAAADCLIAMATMITAMADCCCGGSFLLLFFNCLSCFCACLCLPACNAGCCVHARLRLVSLARVAPSRCPVALPRRVARCRRVARQVVATSSARGRACGSS